jgi:hypothetical protein
MLREIFCIVNLQLLPNRNTNDYRAINGRKFIPRGIVTTVLQSLDQAVSCFGRHVQKSLRKVRFWGISLHTREHCFLSGKFE